MNTQTAKAGVEQNRWKDYLTDFSRRNENRPARLEILGDEIGASEEGQHLPFIMASYEEKGSEAGNALISLGGTGGADARQLTHTISEVTSITPQIGDDGRDAALEIAGADGTKAILIFEQPLQIGA
ncbi:MAG TPA: DUF5335 family protein [Pyrinomonadaceae bacterium]|jgi:hypothetical protein|nr:DUF5335 family protein [Pyrinomonadaceae bacterium]